MSAKQAIINTLDTLPEDTINALFRIVSELKSAEAVKPVRPPFEFGRMKGEIQEADGHDWFEPLEDFKEYME